MADVSAVAAAAMLICMQITGAHFSREERKNVVGLIKPGESCMMHQKLAPAVHRHLGAAQCNGSWKRPGRAINAKPDQNVGSVNVGGKTTTTNGSKAQ